MSSKSTRKRIVTISWVVGAFYCVFTCAAALGHFPIPPKKSEIGRRVVDKPVKNFILTDQEGKKFQLADARGKILALTFVYTKCPNVCPCSPRSSRRSSAPLKQAKEEKKPADYLLLTITTDPEYDTPTQLKSYADHFKPNFSNWLFLTGAKEPVAKVWKDFGVNVRKSADGHVQHTALTTLIDRKGMRRVDYYGDKWHENELLQDLVSLAERNQPAH